MRSASTERARAECLAEHLRFRENPRAHLSPERLYVGDDQWQFQQHEADILHRMVGLLRYAADPRHLDLSDHPELREQVARLTTDPVVRPRR